MEEPTDGTLAIGEYHPAARSALAYIQAYICDFKKLMRIKEAFASTALSGNRLAEICLDTLNRVINQESYSDRYLLGLAWTLKNMESTEDKNNEKESN